MQQQLVMVKVMKVCIGSELLRGLDYPLFQWHAKCHFPVWAGLNGVFPSFSLMKRKCYNFQIEWFGLHCSTSLDLINFGGSKIKWPLGLPCIRSMGLRRVDHLTLGNDKILNKFSLSTCSTTVWLHFPERALLVDLVTFKS